MAKYDQFDPADSWQRRREQSLKARNIKITEAKPEQRQVWRRIDRVVVDSSQIGGVVSGRWSSSSSGSANWDFGRFVEIKPRPAPAAKFQPGDMVELNSDFRTISITGFNNLDTLEVVHTNEHFGHYVVSFLGETPTLYEYALQLKDGPW